MLVSNNNLEVQTYFYLPHHITCVRNNTLNLVATTDISKISDKTCINIHKTIFDKLQAFWNLLSRSTVAWDKVVECCNYKVPIPIYTRWNSKYDANQKTLIHKKKISYFI